MFKAVSERPPVERKVVIFTKNEDGSKKRRGELTVKYKAVTTADIDRMIDENLLASEVFDDVVLEAGPVGHPTKTDEAGEPVPLPPEEALEAVRNDWEAMQYVINEFWEINSVDPKSRTSKRRRRRG
jgi:hypothetical protein